MTETDAPPNTSFLHSLSRESQNRFRERPCGSEPSRSLAPPQPSRRQQSPHCHRKTSSDPCMTCGCGRLKWSGKTRSFDGHKQPEFLLFLR